MNVSARIRRVVSPDADPLESWAPAEPGYFGLPVQMLVGPSDGPGEESFDFLVCTPSWFGDNLGGDVRSGRHCVFMLTWDLDLLRRYLEKVVNGAGPRGDWTELCERIGRYGRWEFEDYVPSPDL